MSERKDGKGLPEDQAKLLRTAIDGMAPPGYGKVTALAKRLNVDRAGLSVFLNGKSNGSYQMAIEAARCLNTTPDQLLGLVSSEDFGDYDASQIAALKAARLLGFDREIIKLGLGAESKNKRRRKTPAEWFERIQLAAKSESEFTRTGALEVSPPPKHKRK